MSAADNLRAARALIEDPKHWTQKAYAKDADGHLAAINHGDCFCSIGAIARVLNPYIGLANLDGWDEVALLAQSIGMTAGAGSDGAVTRFNDAPGRTHAEVLAAFDKAIELAENHP